jgi:spermidine/putrescine-binding protein
MNLKKYNWQEYTTKEGLMNLLRETNEDNLIRLAVKELVDNAIDANRKAQQGKRSEDYIPCELGKTDNGFYIRDYGNGFSEKDVKTLFNLKRNFSYSSKYIRTINRWYVRKRLKNGFRHMLHLWGSNKIIFSR